ncbi:hypothetical protein KCTCHS21_43670 [Cohnella abietis]|uniref:Uncharacterized protein n=2 Tax=Cohnella abietis TaxID=2507935 RepID=A0A3T1DAG4_9BACL|nr:hypothetical protein KCTCHS21_43670 [Cohnella abietis]
MNKNSIIYAVLFLFFSVGALLQGFFSDWSVFAVASVLCSICLICYLSNKDKTLKMTWFPIILLLYSAMYILTIGYGIDREYAIIEAGRVVILLPLVILLMHLDREKDWPCI